MGDDQPTRGARDGHSASLENGTQPGGLLSQTVQRPIDQTGKIVERTLDTAGNAVLIQHSVIIARPVEEVFPALLTFEAEPQWPPAGPQTWYTPTGPVRLGTRTYRVHQVLGRPRTTTSIVTTYEPNRRLVSMSLPDTAPTICTTYQAEPCPGGTKLSIAIESEISGWRKVLAPLWQYRLAKEVTSRFARLQAQLEARPGPPAPGLSAEP